MLSTRAIPCLLLRNRGLVKTVQFRKPNYVGDPINTVRLFNEKEVDELVFLDITASSEQREPQYGLLADIASECFMPFAYGGGITNTDQMRQIFNLGAEKVALNTASLADRDLVRGAAELFGSQSVIVSIDVKRNWMGRYDVYSHSDRKKTGRDPVDYAQQVVDQGAGEILLTAVDRDGTMDGYDIELIKAVTRSVSVPVIACGGAGTIDDLGSAVCDGGASAAAAGSMFVYQGTNRAVLINFPSPEQLSSIFSRASSDS